MIFMEIKIREMKESDLEEATNLISRLKRFNSEHDTLFSLNENLEEIVKKYLKDSLGKKERDYLVAEDNGKVVGIIMVEIIDRLFYKPKYEARINEIYILPEYRKKGLGKKMLDEIVTREKIKGCMILTVEFPSENLLAHKFYTGQQMRSIISVYGKNLK